VSTTDLDRPVRPLPPIHQVAMAVIAVVVTGGIYLAAYLPRRAPLGGAFALLAVAAGLLLWNVISLARIQHFAWNTFFLVGKWALLAYGIIAGMLEYVFVFDHTRGSILLVLTLMLAIFAINIPMLLAFSVARYQPVGAADGSHPAG
jgi:hypothetical protein